VGKDARLPTQNTKLRVGKPKSRGENYVHKLYPRPALHFLVEMGAFEIGDILSFAMHSVPNNNYIPTVGSQW